MLMVYMLHACTKPCTVSGKLFMACIMQVTGGADLFIGFGGVVQRPAVAAEAEWYVYDYVTLMTGLKRYQVGHISSMLLQQCVATAVLLHCVAASRCIVCPSEVGVWQNDSALADLLRREGGVHMTHTFQLPWYCSINYQSMVCELRFKSCSSRTYTTNSTACVMQHQNTPCALCL